MHVARRVGPVLPPLRENNRNQSTQGRKRVGFGGISTGQSRDLRSTPVLCIG
jgi:hypothetical protein